MTLDAKHAVLYAIYTEYQKDLPEMALACASALQMDEAVFNVAVLKLQTEGLVSGAEVKFFGRVPYPVMVDLIHAFPTAAGLARCEADLAVEGRTGGEKARQLMSKFASYGWEALTELAARVLVDIGKQIIK